MIDEQFLEMVRKHGMHPNSAHMGEELVAEIDALRAELAQLRVTNARLAGALRLHRHTDKCWQYAAKTARDHGNFYCIADCSNSYSAALATSPDALDDLRVIREAMEALEFFVRVSDRGFAHIPEDSLAALKERFGGEE